MSFPLSHAKQQQGSNKRAKMGRTRTVGEEETSSRGCSTVRHDGLALLSPESASPRRAARLSSRAADLANGSYMVPGCGRSHVEMGVSKAVLRCGALVTAVSEVYSEEATLYPRWNLLLLLAKFCLRLRNSW